jgi:hypothetical protein
MSKEIWFLLVIVVTTIFLCPPLLKAWLKKEPKLPVSGKLQVLFHTILISFAVAGLVSISF